MLNTAAWDDGNSVTSSMPSLSAHPSSPSSSFSSKCQIRTLSVQRPPETQNLLCSLSHAYPTYSGCPSQDEVFHIPQTQRYCDEDFDTWDPAITTPPGLYVPVQALFLRLAPIALISSGPDISSPRSR